MVTNANLFLPLKQKQLESLLCNPMHFVNMQITTKLSFRRYLPDIENMIETIWKNSVIFLLFIMKTRRIHKLNSLYLSLIRVSSNKQVYLWPSERNSILALPLTWIRFLYIIFKFCLKNKFQKKIITKRMEKKDFLFTRIDSFLLTRIYRRICYYPFWD